MTSAIAVSPAPVQASAAVYNVDTVVKQPQTTRDDVVAPIDTSNRQATKNDISVLKMSDSSLGQNIDFKV